MDSRLDGRFDLQEVIEVAAFAYRCISRAPRKRPNMRDVVQVLTFNTSHSRKRQKKISASPSPLPPRVESSGEQTGISSVLLENHRRDNSTWRTEMCFKIITMIIFIYLFIFGWVLG